MSASSLIALLSTLFVIVFTVVMVGVSVVVSLLSVLLPIGLMVWVFSQIQTTPIAVAPEGPPIVKRTVCRGCGAPKVKRTLSAYVYCDYCGELCDWDFRAALADRRSKQPGPAYEQILARTRTALDAARTAGDAVAYETVQKQIWEAFAAACPAALSPRIGDARYRERWIAFSAAHTTAAELDPACKATFDAQQAATRALQWDRSNPFQPRAVTSTFWPLVDAVNANQKAWAQIAEDRGLLDRHPDHPTADLLRRMGTSAFVQGWVPFLTKADADLLLESTGLSGEYVRVEPKPVRDGKCPACAAPLEVVDGAKRVLCHACGHLAGVGGGSLPCHGCGAPIELPASGALFACPNCEAELRMMAWT